jgi:hypothetical protein
MPMTHDTAVESARSAADRYTDAWLARLHAYQLLPADGPGRADANAALGFLRDATRRAFTAFLESVGDLHAAGGEAQAVALILEVQDRTDAARTPVAIPITEADACSS